MASAQTPTASTAPLIALADRLALIDALLAVSLVALPAALAVLWPIGTMA